MFDVFLYLLENYTGITQCPDAPTLARRLTQEGFEEFEVRSAVMWVEQLRQPLIFKYLNNELDRVRLYHETEKAQLGLRNIDLLMQLERNDSINPQQRELIIERAMLLPQPIHRMDTFKALLLTILWADQHEINDSLLHGLIDQIEGDVIH